MKLARYDALLIEDDPAVTELARIAAAESLPGLVLTVLDGFDAALNWLEGIVSDKEQMPHIILLDLKLPKLDGLAVLRTMRNCPALHNTPIVVFSTEHAQDDVLLSYRVGANSFVEKPVDKERFGDLFREQLAYWIRPHSGKMDITARGDAAGRI